MNSKASKSQPTVPTREVHEKLLEWDNEETPLAPLSEKQRDAIFELASACDTNYHEAGSETNDVKSENLITSIGQFTDLMITAENKKVRTNDEQTNAFLGQLKRDRDLCDNFLEEISMSLEHLRQLTASYDFVSGKTNALHHACEQLLSDQTSLVNETEELANTLAYFTELDTIAQKLNSPMEFSVFNESFVPMLSRLDECIEFMDSHPSYMEASAYGTKFRVLLGKALGMIRSYVTRTLEQARLQVMPRQDITSTTDSAFTLFYGKFRMNAPRIKSIIKEVEERASRISEYDTLLQDCHQTYLTQREILLAPSIMAAISELATTHHRDHCSLVRSGCAFLIHVCDDEYQLFEQFFNQSTPSLNDFLEGLCYKMYDVLRPMVIHIVHLETLAELCSILKIEMIEEHVKNNPIRLAAFESVVSQILEDVQERLVYRAHIYIKSDILDYKPGSGDLAYPEKLEMMESIAASLQQQQPHHFVSGPMRSDSTSSVSSLVSVSSVTSQEVAQITGGQNPPRPNKNGSPADMHGMWFPTVRRTLVCLSKLYRCIDITIFQGLSQEALSACMESLSQAGAAITKNRTPVDGLLFQIKHLLILREQIAPFQGDFSIRETSLDFSKVKNAPFRLLQKKNMLFSMDSNNALLEFILQGTTPRVTESFVDSKKDVDLQLKTLCETFIGVATHLISEPLTVFARKAATVSAYNEDARKSSRQLIVLKSQAFAAPNKVADVFTDSVKLLKSKLPVLIHSMSLYLSNKETEAIIFRPIKNNVVSSYEQVLQLVSKEYNEEEQLIVMCPTIEEVTVHFTAAFSKS